MKLVNQLKLAMEDPPEEGLMTPDQVEFRKTFDYKYETIVKEMRQRAGKLEREYHYTLYHEHPLVLSKLVEQLKLEGLDVTTDPKTNSSILTLRW